jgi:hypothetical protein
MSGFPFAVLLPDALARKSFNRTPAIRAFRQTSVMIATLE